MVAVSKHLKGCHIKEEANIICVAANGRARPSLWWNLRVNFSSRTFSNI